MVIINLNKSSQLSVPRNRQTIRTDVYLFRKNIGIEKSFRFPIVTYLEIVLPQMDKDFHLQVVPEKELSGRFAETRPGENTILVRESVYEAAANNHAWARMILAHELGHYVYHQKDSLVFCKMEEGMRVPDDFDPERQADIFAAELLIPFNLIREGMTKEFLAKECCVSQRAANIQLKNAHYVRGVKSEKRGRKRKQPTQRADC